MHGKVAMQLTNFRGIKFHPDPRKYSRTKNHSKVRKSQIRSLQYVYRRSITVYINTLKEAFTSYS